MKAPLDETSVLRPKNPAIDEDEWEEILLTAVDVFAKGTTDHASLLVADEVSPVDVVGKLDPLPRNIHRLLLNKRQSFPVTIRVSNVQHFAYGQDDNMQVVLWADGLAGWFKIRSPSRAYKSWYGDMVEAVNVLFFTADLIGTKKGRKMSAQQIFEKFAAQENFDCSDADGAASIFKKHRQFLLHKMYADGESIRWKGTAIMEYLEKEQDDEETGMSDITPIQSSDDEAARLASKGKSSLRPRSGKHTKKSAKRQSALATDGDEAMLDAPSPETPSVLKRKKTQGRPESRKKANTSRDGSATPKPEDTLPLNVGNKSRTQQDHYTAPIISKPILSYEPQDKVGDVWTCTNDGCNHKVYKASTKASKALIKEHYNWHAVESQRQMDLVYKEERPYLPVGNLIKKIQEVAAQQESGTDPAIPIPDAYPQPVKRRY